VDQAILIVDEELIQDELFVDDEDRLIH